MYYRYVLCICCVVFLLLQGCGCGKGPFSESSEDGVLRLDLAGDVVFFEGGQVGVEETKSILLFNLADRKPIEITSIGLSGDGDFRLLDTPQTPFSLVGGESGGKLLKVSMKLKQLSDAKAVLRIFYKISVDPVQNREVLIDVVHRSHPVRLRWSCGGTLSFGVTTRGKTLEKECVIDNLGKDDVTLTGVSYEKTSGGDAIDFAWISPEFPVVLRTTSRDGVTVRIRYTPSDEDAGIDEGVFVFATKRKLARKEDTPRLFVKGETPVPRLSITPLYRSCQSDADCQGVVPGMVCLLDQPAGTNMCQSKPGDALSLAFPLTTRGDYTQGSFRLRNVGALPLTITKMVLEQEDGAGFQFLKELSLPLVLQPEEERVVDMSYGPFDGKAAKGKVVISSNSVGAPVSTLLLQVAISGCHMEFLPARLSFTKVGTMQVDMINRGNSPCEIKGVSLRSGESQVFRLLAGDYRGIVQPGSKRLFSIKFETESKETFVDAVVVEFIHASVGRVEVPVVGRLEPQIACDLRPSLAALNFGAIKPVGQRRMRLLLRNYGTGDCVVHGIDVMGTSPFNNKAFQVVAVPNFPKVLKPETEQVLDVTYDTLGVSGLHGGMLKITIDDPKKPTLEVRLVASTAGTCLELFSSRLDFGGAKPGCGTMQQTLTLYNPGDKGCSTKVTLSQVKLSRDADGAFLLVQKPSLPLELTGGQSASIVMSYKAKALGPSVGALEVELGGDAIQKLSIPLSGEGFPLEQQKDLFQQWKKPLLDILWVVDDSSSMVEEQTNLVSNATAWSNWMIRQNVDFRILVTTTDLAGGRFAAGCAQGQIKWIGPHTPNPTTTFLSNLNVGTKGSEQASGLEAARMALSEPARSGCNQGFFRDDAWLSLIFVSDGKDESKQPVSYYASFLRSLKEPLRQDLLSVSAVVGDLPAGCDVRNVGKAEAAPRYREFVDLLGGVNASICHKDWAAVMQHLQTTSFGYRLRYALRRPADESSIVVRVSGVLVRKSAFDGWSYDPKVNEVIFANSAVPGPEARIEIDYLATCLP